MCQTRCASQGAATVESGNQAAVQASPVQPHLPQHALLLIPLVQLAHRLHGRAHKEGPRSLTAGSHALPRQGAGRASVGRVQPGAKRGGSAPAGWLGQRRHRAGRRAGSPATSQPAGPPCWCGHIHRQPPACRSQCSADPNAARCSNHCAAQRGAARRTCTMLLKLRVRPCRSLNASSITACVAQRSAAGHIAAQHSVAQRGVEEAPCAVAHGVWTAAALGAAAGAQAGWHVIRNAQLLAANPASERWPHRATAQRQG